RKFRSTRSRIRVELQKTLPSTDLRRGLSTMPLSEEIDLSAADSGAFAPYLNERNEAWMILPAFALAIVLIHLKKSKSRRPLSLLAALAVWATIETGVASEVQPLRAVLISVMGKVKVQHEKKNGAEFYFAKDAKNKLSSIVFIEDGLYPPDCKHTW